MKTKEKPKSERPKLPFLTCSHEYASLDSSETHYLFFCTRCLDLREVEKPKEFKSEEQQQQRPQVGFTIPYIGPRETK